jgi:hypothetical protein
MEEWPVSKLLPARIDLAADAFMNSLLYRPSVPRSLCAGLAVTGLLLHSAILTLAALLAVVLITRAGEL